MGLHKSLEINNKTIDESLHFMLESPLKLFHAIDRIMMLLDTKNFTPLDGDLAEISDLKRALLKISDHNNRHLFSETLKELGLKKLAKEEHESIDSAMDSFYRKLRKGEIKVTSNI